MVSKEIKVKKLDGTEQKYDPSKLRKSLLKSGADEETIDKIMTKVEPILFNGIETKKFSVLSLRNLRSFSLTLHPDMTSKKLF